jgi:hypothetical protein
MSLKRLNIQTQKRTVGSRAPFDADTWTDTLSELTTDLAELSKQWNQLLVPLLLRVPDGSQDSAIDAYINSLDSRTLYANWEATDAEETLRFYNLVKNRPYTIYEVLLNLYNEIASGTGGSGGGDTTIIQGDSLTQAEKERIGINVFDSSQISSDVSIDGKADNNNLNIIQIAKDLYGVPGWVLNDDGNPILTNSAKAMVDALLELHNGNWSNDITLNHNDIPELISIRTFIGQSSISEIFPTYNSFNFISNGAPLETAISQLDAAMKITLTRAYSHGTTAADQSINPTDARGGPLRINGIISNAGVWSGTAALIANLGDVTSGGSEKNGHIHFKNSTPTSTGLSNNPHLAVRVNDTLTTAIKDVIQVEAGQYAATVPGVGFGVGIGFGTLTATGSGAGFVGDGRIATVLVDPTESTLTSAIILAAKGENNDMPSWDDGAVSFLNSKVQTTNNTEAVALSIPIPNTTIRVMNAKTNIIGTTSNGLNYASFDIRSTFSTSIGSASIVNTEDDFGGSGSGWNGRVAYTGGNYNVYVSGVNSTTINWRVGVQLFGIRA